MDDNHHIRRGRPRTYDPGEALERATEAFWRQGYSATSLDALSEATRMNRPSLYGAFGDKHALYTTALERYIAEGRSQMEAALDDELPPQVRGVIAQQAQAIQLAHDEVRDLRDREVA